MAVMASSTTVPIFGWGALALRCSQRASLGTQKMLAARYSSGSSGSAPWARWDSNSACLASKASEMYFRKMRPRTTCLYSAASMLLRSASAAAHSFDSNPMAVLVPTKSASFGQQVIGKYRFTSCGARKQLENKAASALRQINEPVVHKVRSCRLYCRNRDSISRLPRNT
jgi:hypothetical protein